VIAGIGLIDAAPEPPIRVRAMHHWRHPTARAAWCIRAAVAALAVAAGESGVNSVVAVADRNRIEATGKHFVIIALGGNEGENKPGGGADKTDKSPCLLYEITPSKTTPSRH
jgi:hypothetical protein